MMTRISISDIIHNKTFRQTTSLFGSGIFLSVLSTVTTPIITRTLGPVDYGLLIFFYTITSFILQFFNFGYFFTVGVLLAETSSQDEQRRLIGSSMIITLVIGASYAFFLFLLSFVVDPIFHTSIGSILKFVAPFLILNPVITLITNTGKGTNRIDSMVYGLSLPKVVRALLLVILWMTGHLTLFSIIILEVLLSFIPAAIVFLIFKPTFSSLKNTVSIIMKKNREVGFHMYLALIAGQTTYELDGIMIPIFADPVQLGYYRLANAFPYIMNNFSTSLASSEFRTYSKEPRISRKTILINYGILGIGSLGTIIMGKLIIRLVAGASFNVPFGLVLPVGILGFLHGSYQPYAQFLIAKGKGKWIRDIGFISMAVNIIGNFTLIPLFGAIGAAWASVLSRGIGCLSNIYFYRRIVS
ncbi:oligosaccharide flippase family protein [bacterium]|nr:oligosaccharide flippase family protein [bacterium]